MATSETTPSFVSKLHILAMQSVVPARVTDPGQRSRIIGQIRHQMYREHLQVVLYYNKAHEEEDGRAMTGWLKDSLSRTLSEEPMLAGRLQRSPDEEGELAIAFNDSGVRLVNAQMELTLSELLNLEEREEAEAKLAFWKDVDEENPQYSALFYVQVTSFYGDGYSIGITCSLLLADPLQIISFLNKWTSTLNQILTQNNNPNTPMFFYPNLKKTGDSPSPILTPLPCTPTHHQTIIYKLAGTIHANRFANAPQHSHAYKEIAALAFRQAAQKPSTVSVIFIDRSGDRKKVSTFTREEVEGLVGSISSLEIALSLTSWDDLRGDEISFYKGNMPVSVTYHIVSKPYEGVVLIMPPLEEGSLGITISITVPK